MKVGQAVNPLAATSRDIPSREMCYGLPAFFVIFLVFVTKDF